MDPGNIGKVIPTPPESSSQESDRELKEDFMIGNEGICHDYFNQILTIEMYYKSLLSLPGWSTGIPIEEAQRELLNSINSCVSYSEYFKKCSKNPKSVLAFTKFLTERGKEIWKRLDKIIEEIKSIAQSKLERADLEKLHTLFEEAKSYLDH